MTILVQQLRERASRATPGPWELQASNSWRRIGTAGGRFADGDVLAPTTHRGDNHPDLAARQEDLDFIVAADPATVLALLDELDTAIANHENAVAHMQSVCAERDQLKAENAELIGLMRGVVGEFPHRHKGSDGNGPGHGHRVPGVWDSDNGELAGKPCAWCSIWNAAKGIVERHEQAMTKEQP
ncbi:ead/Ea22-like family protein [Pseudomonas benzopyrenica]|uniref:Ead/Ea22-like family protein n=1 Tax=Pseudomonas benzopyrenica TaxID=2993566 RepID=A0ABZ2FMP7_9PSED